MFKFIVIKFTCIALKVVFSQRNIPSYILHKVSSIHMLMILLGIKIELDLKFVTDTSILILFLVCRSKNLELIPLY